MSDDTETANPGTWWNRECVICAHKWLGTENDNCTRCAAEGCYEAEAENWVKVARIRALQDAMDIAQNVMRLAADTGSTSVVVGAKIVRDDISALMAKEAAL